MHAIRRLPIRLRMALWFGTLLLILVGAIGILLLPALESLVRDQIDTALRLRASRVEREIASGDNGGLEDGRLDPQDVRTGLLELEPLEEFSSPGIYVQVRGLDGAVLAASSNLPRGELPVTPGLIAEALNDREAFETVPIGGESVRVLAWPVDPNGPVVGIIMVGQSLRILEVTREEAERLILIAVALATLAALVGGWLLISRALDPIADVTRVAHSIAATGRFDQRIAQPAADDEVGHLVVTFNEMLARLERMLATQREFLADASHEFRSPLMVIRGNLDLLRLGLPEEARRASIREAGEEVDRMSRLAADLLFLAAAEAEDVVELESICLDEVVVAAWERARSVDDQAHQLRLPRNEPVVVCGDRARLDQLVWNLVENALRYTPPGGSVELALGVDGGDAVLRVADTGVGIASEHLPRIFERFYRVDKARSRRNGGTGLGLAIVKGIAEAHGGQVDVMSEEGKGTTFTVRLPRQPIDADTVHPPPLVRASDRETQPSALTRS